MGSEKKVGDVAGKGSAVLRAMGLVAAAAGFCVVCSDYIAGGNEDLGGGGGGRGNDIGNYKTTQIGGATWMAENLDYAIRGSACPDSSQGNCQSVGRLYTWEAAMKACPKGWRLPDTNEWNALASNLNLGVVGIAGGRAKAKGSGFNNGCLGHHGPDASFCSNNFDDIDDFCRDIYCETVDGVKICKAGLSNCLSDPCLTCPGFDALPGGYTDGNGNYLQGDAYWWTSTSRSDAIAWYRFIYFDPNNTFLYSNSNTKRIMYSVRCVKD